MVLYFNALYSDYFNSYTLITKQSQINQLCNYLLNFIPEAKHRNFGFGSLLNVLPYNRIPTFYLQIKLDKLNYDYIL